MKPLQFFFKLNIVDRTVPDFSFEKGSCEKIPIFWKARREGAPSPMIRNKESQGGLETRHLRWAIFSHLQGKGHVGRVAAAMMETGPMDRRAWFVFVLLLFCTTPGWSQGYQRKVEVSWDFSTATTTLGWYTYEQSSSFGLSNGALGFQATYLHEMSKLQSPTPWARYDFHLRW